MKVITRNQYRTIALSIVWMGSLLAEVAKTTVELPPPLHRKLRVKAVVEDRTINDIMADCVEECLDDFRIDPGSLEVETVRRDRADEAAETRRA